MIFVHYTNYHVDIYTVRDSDTAGLFAVRGTFFDHAPYVSFEKENYEGIPLKDLKGFELCGHQIAGAWRVGAQHFDTNLTANSDNYSLYTLLLWWFRHRVQTPFVQWLHEMPHLRRRNRNGHSAYGFFYTYEGKALYVSLTNGKLEATELQNSLFIRDGKTTLLVETMEHELARAEAHVRDVKDKHKTLTTEPYDVVDRIRDSGLINFVN